MPRRALWQVYELPRYMTVAEAVAQLLEVEAAEGGGAYGPDTLAVGVARLGSPNQLVCRIRCRQTCNLAEADSGLLLVLLILTIETVCLGRCQPYGYECVMLLLHVLRTVSKALLDVAGSGSAARRAGKGGFWAAAALADPRWRDARGGEGAAGALPFA